MTISHRIALAVSASALVFGLGFAPAANAADAMMSKSSMHKHMKKKGGMMKSDSMMKSDDTAK